LSLSNMKISFFVLLFFYNLSLTFSQTGLPLIHSTKKYVTIRDGAKLLKDYWTITPAFKPDTWDVIVPAGQKKHIAFITDSDSISFEVELGKSYQFIILLNEKDSAFTRIETHPLPAIFSQVYISKFNNQTVIEVPEFYEFLNIAIALTNKGSTDTNIVYHHSIYYNDVLKWFWKFHNEKIITELDSVLNADYWNYYNLRMDAYAFYFSNDKVVRSEIFDRISWGGKNNLLPYIDQLEKLAVKSDFKKFYKEHQVLYNKQIAYFKDSLQVSSIRIWLNENFPSTNYNCVRIIFSPLSGKLHSANWFDNNNFKEVQAYVNYPYEGKTDKETTLKMDHLKKGNVVFNEIAHVYINPESEKYTSTNDFQDAFKSLNYWETDNSLASKSYSNAYACFNEYMNWSIVCLRYTDSAPVIDAKKLIDSVKKEQVERGFTQFAEFNSYLIDIYKNRKKGKVIADLYPFIIKWCDEQIK
jgi:hypothetical protein